MNWTQCAEKRPWPGFMFCHMRLKYWATEDKTSVGQPVFQTGFEDKSERLELGQCSSFVLSEVSNYLKRNRKLFCVCVGNVS